MEKRRQPLLMSYHTSTKQNKPSHASLFFFYLYRGSRLHPPSHSRWSTSPSFSSGEELRGEASNKQISSLVTRSLSNIVILSCFHSLSLLPLFTLFPLTHTLSFSLSLHSFLPLTPSPSPSLFYTQGGCTFPREMAGRYYRAQTIGARSFSSHIDWGRERRGEKRGQDSGGEE